MATLRFVRAHDGGLEEFPIGLAGGRHGLGQHMRGTGKSVISKKGQAILRFSLTLIDVPPFCIRESSANDHDEVNKDPNA
jgi:hypothetical protein